MAIGDATNFSLGFGGSEILLEGATLNGGSVKLTANFNVTGGAGFSKNFVVSFGGYVSNKGVSINAITIPDLPINSKLVSYNIYDNSNNDLLFPITLDPVEQLEFPDGGILYIAELTINSYGTF